MTAKLDLMYLIPHLRRTTDELLRSGALEGYSLATLKAMEKGGLISPPLYDAELNRRLVSATTTGSNPR